MNENGLSVEGKLVVSRKMLIALAASAGLGGAALGNLGFGTRDGAGDSDARLAACNRDLARIEYVATEELSRYEEFAEAAREIPACRRLAVSHNLPEQFAAPGRD